MVLETEAAIMANFEYLGHDDVEMDDEDGADDIDDQQDDDQDEVKSAKHKGKVRREAFRSWIIYSFN